MTELPASLMESAQEVWQRLRQAADDPSHPWGLVSLSTVGSGGPEQRLLVLREADPTERLLYCHTDVRSAKVSQLQRDPRACWLFYDRQERMQLIVHGEASVIATGPLADRQWHNCRPESRFVYLTPFPPGSPAKGPVTSLPSDWQTRIPTAEESEKGRANFAVIRGSVEEMDLLILRGAGNLRSRFRWSGEAWEQSWIYP